MKTNIRVGLYLLLLSVLFIGCIPTEQVEKIAIITARGVDLVDEDQLEATLVVFQFAGEAQKHTKIVSGKGNTLKAASNDADLESIYPIAPGKIQIELYGIEMAKKGILPLLDTLQRDARVANTMYLSISDTTAKQLLSVPHQTVSQSIGEFLHGLIENNATDHNFPKITLQDFLRTYYDVGKDNVLPIFEIQENNIPKITKIGLFKGDKLSGILSIKEATLLNLLDSKVKEKIFGMTVPTKPFLKYIEDRENRSIGEETHISFLIEKGKSKTRLKGNKENLSFETEVNLELRLVEQDEGIILKDRHVMKILEKEVQKKLVDDFNKLLAKTQELQVDPFGYGIIYRINEKDHKLTKTEWREKYPEIDVTFKVKPKIIRHGTTE